VSLPPDYFDAMYADSPDPWGFRTRWYERRKRDLTLACLPAARYGSVFEPGCSIGVLTAGLATRADRVLGMDLSAAALWEARQAVPAHVELVEGSVPADWPGGHWSLVVISEVGYYLDREECTRLAGLAVGSCDELVAVHWRHRVDDYPLDGDEVHRILAEAAGAGGMSRVARHCEADLILEVWSSDGRSVARRDEVPGA
jgi:SAM-dependent methyltransferase